MRLAQQSEELARMSSVDILKKWLEDYKQEKLDRLEKLHKENEIEHKKRVRA